MQPATAFPIACTVIAAGAMAVAATVALSVGEQVATTCAAAVLAAGDAGAALFFAGARERVTRTILWVRCGLAAAIFSFVAIIVLALPTLYFALGYPAAGDTIVANSVLAVCMIAALALVWFSGRLAWRWFAPKGEA